jgi:Tol biopolymer transport system component
MRTDRGQRWFLVNGLQAAWSPDGSKVAFSSVYGGEWVNGITPYDIFTINADGSGLTRLTTDPREDVQPAWSPDGSKITFSSLRIGPRSSGYEIYTMNADGSNQVQLTEKGGTDPTWSPDGSTIAFTKGIDGGSNLEIYSIGVDGSNEANLTNSPWSIREMQPAWMPSSAVGAPLGGRRWL